jgi:hypothetical protein
MVIEGQLLQQFGRGGGGGGFGALEKFISSVQQSSINGIT